MYLLFLDDNINDTCNIQLPIKRLKKVIGIFNLRKYIQ